jgi:hypothetical protein
MIVDAVRAGNKNEPVTTPAADRETTVACENFLYAVKGGSLRSPPCLARRAGRAIRPGAPTGRARDEHPQDGEMRDPPGPRESSFSEPDCPVRSRSVKSA